MNSTHKKFATRFELVGELISENWLSRLFIALQIAICFNLELGHRGRIIAALVVVISIVAERRFKLSKSLHSLVVLGSGFLFTCFALSRFFGERSAGIPDLFELLAEFLIVVQSLELLRKRASTWASYHEANYLPGLGTITIILLLVSREISLSPSILASLSIGFVVLVLLVTRPDFVDLFSGNSLQRRKAATLAMIAATGLSAGALFRGEVTRQLPVLQAALRTIQPPRDEVERVAVGSNARFVDQVDLSSISLAQRTAPDELVFRVEATQYPGYMRTISFEKFDGNTWSNHWDTDRRAATIGARRIPPLSELPDMLNGISKTNDAQWFELPDRREGKFLDMKISIPKGHGRQVPLPLTSAYILANSEGRTKALVLDLHGNVWPSSISNGEYHVVAGASSNWPIDETYANRLLQLPDRDAEFIKSHSAHILGSVQSTREKVPLLEDYFRTEFEYAFEEDAIGERRGRSPLQAFLENRKAGHCEYFATASTLLLRAQGIPCRLSTGYLVYEMNEDREYFFARNRDAHAWAEAYDESTGSWILVESTPGIQAHIERFRSNETQLVQADNGAVSSKRTLASNFQVLFANMQTWWSQVLASRFSWLIPLALGGALWRIRARRINRAWKDSLLYTSKEVRKADKRALRMGYDRAAGETCLQFARRLSDSGSPGSVRLAEWYVGHSQSRYKSS